MATVAVIPARYESSRFPGKILAHETGKYLIEHVYERVQQARRIDHILIATDDERIGSACDRFGAAWCMTRTDHQSGTDRVAEAVATLDAEIVVNVQGDEPEILPDNIDMLVQIMQHDAQAQMGTLASLIDQPQDIQNPNIVKVVVDRNGHALYFSRWPIPYCRDVGGIAPAHQYRRHLGIYAYRKPTLLNLSQLTPTPLEQTEKLEQLRALENGIVIAVADVQDVAAGIDTPDQYAAFVQRCRGQ